MAAARRSAGRHCQPGAAVGHRPFQRTSPWERRQRPVAPPLARCIRDVYRPGRSTRRRVGRSAVRRPGRRGQPSHRALAGGAVRRPTAPVHISVPAARRVTAQPGIRVHLRRALGNDGRPITHPSAAPPRIRLEVSLLDQCETETREGTTHLVLRAIQRRLTTADRLRSALRARPRHRWRGLVSDILAETAAGVASPLELHYRREVELRHRLPPGIRNAQDIAPGGGHWYRDVHNRRWRVIVELDGREAHPIDAAFRDLRRDNLAAVAGETVLRYGWRDVIGNPCNVAAQVASVLAARG